MRSNAHRSPIRARAARLLVSGALACSFLGATASASSAGDAVPVIGRSITFVLGGHLVATGRVSGPDEQRPARPRECTKGVPVQLQRRRSEGWATIKQRDTGDDRRYRIRVPDRQGTYRVKAPEVDAVAFQCVQVVSPALRHRH
jgi:hypothetical protein